MYRALVASILIVLPTYAEDPFVSPLEKYMPKDQLEIQAEFNRCHAKLAPILNEKDQTKKKAMQEDYEKDCKAAGDRLLDLLQKKGVEKWVFYAMSNNYLRLN